MAQIHSRQSPYAPRRGYLIPALSLALSVPSLIATFSLSALAITHALTGYNLPVSMPPLQSALEFTVIVCYIVFGPMLGLILCVSQRARAEQLYGSDLLLGYRMRRLNTIALWSAGVAISAMMLVLLLTMALRGGT
ncbi:MAG TPA: hypothetical protein VE338_01020 [Ktedonobacterales bacterium]|jgi:hypothetical protein|nr:hypothetical protein [Ktedonobacterales bacterium]